METVFAAYSAAGLLSFVVEVAALPKQSEKAEIEAVIHDVVHINPRGTVS